MVPAAARTAPSGLAAGCWPCGALPAGVSSQRAWTYMSRLVTWGLLCDCMNDSSSSCSQHQNQHAGSRLLALWCPSCRCVQRSGDCAGLSICQWHSEDHLATAAAAAATRADWTCPINNVGTQLLSRHLLCRHSWTAQRGCMACSACPDPKQPWTLHPVHFLTEHAAVVQAFMDSAKGMHGMQRLPGPPLSLSPGDQCRIRDRSTIVGRHLFADRGDGYADQQVCIASDTSICLGCLAWSCLSRHAAPAWTPSSPVPRRPVPHPRQEHYRGAPPVRRQG